MSKNADNEALIFHFNSEEMQLLKGGELQDCVVSEPVKKGDLLVTISEENAPEDFELAAGDNSELSVNQDSILAGLSGYPFWELEDDSKCVMSVEPFVKIPKGNMVAEMVLYPDISGNRKELQALLVILAEAGVVFGIEEQAIKEAIAQSESEEKQMVAFDAAKGTPARHGVDAHTKIEVELGTIAGEKQEDGSLNFKERRMFVYADEGQTIATVVPATSGTAGKNVKGGAIEPRAGKEVTVRVTEDAVYDEEKGVVVAGKGGVVSVVNDTTFKV